MAGKRKAKTIELIPTPEALRKWQEYIDDFLKKEREEEMKKLHDEWIKLYEQDKDSGWINGG